MRKITSLLLLCFLCFASYTTVYAQKKSKNRKFGTVYKKDGTEITGKIKNFYGAVSFEKVDPLYMIKSIFDKDLPNYFSLGPQAISEIKLKTDGSKKFQKIPFEEIEGIMMSRNFKTSGGDKVYFKTFSGPNFYGKKKKKNLNIALPTLTQGEVINTYGTIYPLRSIFVVYPFLFEVGTPDAFGMIFIENKKRKLALSLGFIKQEKLFTKNKVKRREKNKKANLNYNTINELFGDCPETKTLIEKYYIKQIEDKSERKQAAIDYNRKLKKNIKGFRQHIRKNRNYATPELYLSLYEFDLMEIINAYEKNCLPIDEFDPRHENYKKEFDILLRKVNDTL